MTTTPVVSQPIQQQAAEIIQAMRDAVPVVTEALVQLTFAQGIAKLCIAAVLLLVVAASQTVFWRSVFAKPKDKDGRYTESEAGVHAFSFFGGGFISLIAGFGMVSYLADGLIYVLAPEGQTIMNVIHAMRGAVQ